VSRKIYLQKEFSLMNQLGISSDISYYGLLGYDSLLSAGVTYISEECAASIFKVEMETVFFQNDGTHIPDHMVDKPEDNNIRSHSYKRLFS
jgi:hypothetical protein